MEPRVALLEVDRLTVRFGGLTAVDGVGFSVDEGQVVSLIGPNGAGKTTVFNAITALHPPTRGGIRFAGGDLRSPPSRAALAGILVAGALTALAVQIAFDCEGLWRAAVTDLYDYSARSWPIGQAVRSAFRHLVGLGPYPAAIGGAVGLAAALNSWWVARW